MYLLFQICPLVADSIAEMNPHLKTLNGDMINHYLLVIQDCNENQHYSIQFLSMHPKKKKKKPFLLLTLQF